MDSVLDEMRAVLEGDEEWLMHYGTKRHSGRYPYGSGDDPFQHEGDFLTRIERLRSEGWKETAENIQKEFGMKLEDYRNEKYWSEYTRKVEKIEKAKSLKEKGLEKLGDIKYKTKWYPNGATTQAMYLTVMHRPDDNGLDFNFEHQVDAVSKETLEYFYYYLCKIMFKGIERPNLTISEIIKLV